MTLEHDSLQERAEEEGGRFNSTYAPPWVPESITATPKQTPDKVTSVTSGEQLTKTVSNPSHPYGGWPVNTQRDFPTV